METFDVSAWVILPFTVFFARIADVTLGTLRIIFTSRGRQKIAPVPGFVEVFIWIVVVGQTVKNVHSITAYFGYAAGFAAGTYVGMKIEENWHWAPWYYASSLRVAGRSWRNVLARQGMVLPL